MRSNDVTANGLVDVGGLLCCPLTETLDTSLQKASNYFAKHRLF